VGGADHCSGVWPHFDIDSKDWTKIADKDGVDIVTFEKISCPQAIKDINNT
tara:strand:+ start:495 stop:647 length:153 start_codon:yes stop_codon:yes gene_type:complete